MNGQRAVFVGDLSPHTTTTMRYRALKRLGFAVAGINSAPPTAGWKRAIRSIEFKLFKMGLPVGLIDFGGISGRMLEAVTELKPEVLWLDKCLSLNPAALVAARQASPATRIVGYSPDDMAARHNQSQRFVVGLRLHDVYFTTKTFGVAELKALGCPDVRFIPNAYDPLVHRPVQLSVEDTHVFGSEITFVGGFEIERARSLYYLATQGLPVRVFGSFWDLSPLSHDKMRIEYREALLADYAKALCAAKINLCFLRKINRDFQTQRSVEIPACGGFMLAERTEEHLSLFEEGKEAEFFSSDEELRDKCRFYLQHESVRRAVALAGRSRCLRGGYSYDERLKTALNEILPSRF